MMRPVRVGTAMAVLGLGCVLAAWEMPITSERREAGRLAPALLIARPSDHEPVAPVRVMRVRVLADREYRSGAMDWRNLARSLFDRVNKFVGPAFAVRIEAVDWKRWDRTAPDENIFAMLRELKSYEPGEDVDLVVGLVTPAALLISDIHHAGAAEILGKHLVMRSFVNPAEAEVFQQGFEVLPVDEREKLYYLRKSHKEEVIFLHEWAHALGAIHDHHPASIMNPLYNHKRAALLWESTRVIEISLRHRMAAGHDRAAEAAELAAFVREHRTSGWDAKERAETLSMLDAFAQGGGGQGELGDTAGATMNLSAAKLAVYNQAVQLFNQGARRRAWDVLAPLVANHGDEVWVQTLGCMMLPDVGELRAGRACERAAALAMERRLWEPALRVARVWAASDKAARAMDMLTTAVSRASASKNKEAVNEAARMAIELGVFGEAERVAAALDDAASKAKLRTEIEHGRARMGVPPDLVLANALGCAVVFWKISDALAGNAFADAERALKARAADCASPGFEALACELSLRRGRAAEGKRQCAKAVARFPATARAQYLLGHIALTAGQTRTAATHLEKAVQADPRSEAAYGSLARVYAAQGRKEELAALEKQHQDRFERPLLTR
jgi:tetratricopeptide (TPR) repeat protein